MKNPNRLNSLIIFISALLFISSLSNSVHAVSEAAALFLLISPSPLANGMGQTYGNISSTDPMASIFNVHDAAAYDQLMGRWSKRLAPKFIKFSRLRENDRNTPARERMCDPMPTAGYRGPSCTKPYKSSLPHPKQGVRSELP
ncbi:MAG: hypothetical protein MUC94_01440, partial [bacterium]|nr:hypothetical protein [bacterium]